MFNLTLFSPLELSYHLQPFGLNDCEEIICLILILFSLIMSCEIVANTFHVGIKRNYIVGVSVRLVVEFSPIITIFLKEVLVAPFNAFYCFLKVENLEVELQLLK